MSNIVDSFVDRFLRDRQDRLKLSGIILLLAVVVIFMVYWSLHYTGVAITNEVNCGLEEHQHDDGCYDLELTCGLEESEGTAGHTHDDSCCMTVTELVCGLEETEGHIHDDACFDGSGNLICAIPETEGHIHDDSCYMTVTELVCGLEEEPAAAGHTHTESCYTKVLTCGIPEHVHTMACMTDETADLETVEDWELTLPEEEELTGVWAEDVVLIAESQMDYTESTANFRLADDGETKNGYTRYGAWYGNEYGAWDAMFAAFCLYYAGVTEDYMPYNAGAYAWTVDLEEAGIYEPAEEYVPNAGDIVFLDTDGDDKADTAAIVENVLTDPDDGSVSLKLVQGDHDDAVAMYTVDPDDGEILGYGRIPEQPEEEAEETGPADPADVTEDDPAPEPEPDPEEEPGASGEPEEDSSASGEAGGEASGEASEEMSLTTLTCEGEDYTIMVSYGPEAGLPEGVELTASEYSPDSDVYALRYAEAAELYGWDDEEPGDEPGDGDAEDTGEDTGDSSVRLFNIGLYIEDENGEKIEVEPAAAIEVTITYHGGAGESDSHVFTITLFGGDEAENVESESGTSSDGETVTFELGSSAETEDPAGLDQ